MAGNLTIDDPAEAEPITLAEAKAHLRVDFNTDDAYITALITAAREYCEKKQSRVYIETALIFSFNGIPGIGREIWLPVRPIISIDAVKIAQKGGTVESPADITVAAAQYDVDLAAGKIVLNKDFAPAYDAAKLPPYNSFIIEFTAGYGDAATDVPATIKQAMLLIIGHWYEHREDVADKPLTQIPVAAAALLLLDRNF
jgi:uncharacterized phiE125 gp8 family phage protein